MESLWRSVSAGDSRVSNHIPTLMMVEKIEFPYSTYLSEVSRFPVFSALSLSPAARRCCVSRHILQSEFCNHVVIYVVLMFIHVLDWNTTIFSVRVISAGVVILKYSADWIILPHNEVLFQALRENSNGVNAEDHSRRVLIRSGRSVRCEVGYRCHIWKCRTHLAVCNV